MNLTLEEQLELSRSSEFQGIVEIGASRFANDFMESEKVFDIIDKTDPQNPVNINQEASGYLNKMHQFAVKVLNHQVNKQGGLINALQNIIFIIMADKQNWKVIDLKGGDKFSKKWENDAGFNEIILTAFERLSGITKKEKIDYNLI